MNLTAVLLLISLSSPLRAQEASVGVAVPITITGGVFHDSDGDTSASYRAVFYPTVKLGPKWFVYSAIQVGSPPYSYPASYDQKGNFQVRALQAFLGRTWTAQKVSVTLKAGQLASAFGSFPLRYDDMANPLIDQPIPYVSVLKPGGDITNVEGIRPATLYGLPGAEVDISSGKVDARLQLTNSSPANPQNLLSGNQQVQWAAGAGYTLRHGLRIGVSAFRGPYLDRNIATGVGADLQWAKGRWSAEGEWQRFQFDSPQFVASTAVSFGYVEVKAILTPRLYAATRLGYQKYNSDPFLSGRRCYEVALGYRPNRWQLFKIEYQKLRVEGEQTFDTILAFQLVTSIQSLSKTLR